MPSTAIDCSAANAGRASTPSPARPSARRVMVMPAPPSTRVGDRGEQPHAVIERCLVDIEIGRVMHRRNVAAEDEVDRLAAALLHALHHEHRVVAAADRPLRDDIEQPRSGFLDDARRRLARRAADRLALQRRLHRDALHRGGALQHLARARSVM